MYTVHAQNSMRVYNEVIYVHVVMFYTALIIKIIWYYVLTVLINVAVLNTF